ncbi:MAG: family 16 glycosylhydrolase [Actinomycetes bacterium]
MRPTAPTVAPLRRTAQRRAIERRRALRRSRLTMAVASTALAIVAACQMPAARAATTTTTTTFVDTGATWRYVDSGVAPASNWNAVGYSDGAWKSGAAQLGAGDGDERTKINRLKPAHRIDWFRRTFSVADATAVASLNLALVADDAAYVFLNGKKVVNDNVAANGYPVAPRSGTAENAVRNFSVATGALRTGTNVLAVELRQDYTSDPDASFSAKLTGQVATTTTTTSTTSTTTTSTSTTTTSTSTTTTSTSTTSTTVPATVLPVGPSNFRTLRFADEFNGTAIDTTRWKPYFNTYGSGNHQFECNSPNNVAVANGMLTINSRKETVTCGDGKVMNYTSGFLGSRETGRYYPREAYYEIRARVPHAQGMWPAFWLRHSSGSSVAEVDVMEYFHSQVPGKVTQTLHLDGVHNLWKKTTPFETPTTSPGWHTFGVAIEAVPTGQQFTMYIDGVATGTFVDTAPGWATTGDPNAMFDIAINQAVAGDWAGEPDGVLGELPNVSRCSISGTYPGGCSTTGIRRWSGSENYQVDYVRVFTH